jgi:hypothetical protein
VTRDISRHPNSPNGNGHQRDPEDPADDGGSSARARMTSHL